MQMNTEKINLLVVEDDEGFASLLKITLRKDSYEERFNIINAVNLQDCFSVLQSRDTDIVILDLGLPGTTGLETIEKFHKTFPDVPVIVLTANSDESVGIESIKKGASAFIEKSNINCKDLTRTILHSLERHEIQQQLKAEKQKAQTYLDLAGVIIVSIDTDQKISMINKSGCRQLGYSEAQLLKKNWFDIFSPSGKRKSLKEKFDRIITENIETPNDFETVIVNAAGQQRIISWNRKFIRDNNGNITAVLGSGIDVTTEKISNKKLKAINSRIIEHDIQKSEFIINISHELRTPLTIFKNIISNAIAGTTGKINDKLKKELEIGDKVIDRLAGIITDFLEISRIEAGKMKLNLDTIDLTRIINEAIETHKPLIDSNYMQVELHTPNEPVLFTSDYLKMMQILSKLIENAAKFVPDCGGKMIIRGTDLNDKIAIEVEDNGPGIDGPDINRVFNRFIQIERHVGEGGHGTGLGLAITKELVEMHCGRIWVENKDEGGTIFKMIIPKKPPVSAKEQACITSQIERISQIEKNIESLNDQVSRIAELCSESSASDNNDTPPQNPVPPVDWQLAIKYCGDEKVVKRIAESIKADSPEQMQALLEAVKSGIAKEIVYAAHKLKGAIQTIGATDLPEKAATVEIAAGENDFKTINATMPLLKIEYERFTQFLNKEDWTEIAKNAMTTQK